MRIITFILALLVASLVCSGAMADVLTTAENAQKLYGIVLAAQEEATTFAVYNAAAQRFEKRSFKTDSIKLIVVTVDQTLLTQLNFEDLKSVRDAAEQLASIENDPVCRHIATRLLMLLIHHASENNHTDTAIIQSACRNLINIATEANYQLIRKIAWIYGGIKFDPNSVIPRTQIDNDAFLNLLRHLRKEEFRKAESVLPQIKDGLRLAPETYQRLKQCITSRSVDDPTLAWLLKTEQNLLGWVDLEDSPDEIIWMLQHARTKTNSTIGKLTLEQLVEFDVNATRFSQGNWLKP